MCLMVLRIRHIGTVRLNDFWQIINTMHNKYCHTTASIKEDKIVKSIAQEFLPSPSFYCCWVLESNVQHGCDGTPAWHGASTLCCTK